MRIGVVCPYDMASPGGVQQHATELADHLTRAGDEAVLVGVGETAYHRGPGTDGATIPAGRPFRVRGNRSVVPISLSPWSWRRVRDALAEVDVIHVHEPLMPLVGWAALTMHKPHVVTFHADAPSWVKRLYRVSPLGGLFQRAVVTAVSATAAAALPSSWGKVEVIPNGINTDSYDLEVGRIERRVAFLGRDEPRKGLDLLLRAWPGVRESHPAAELVVIGAEPRQDLDGVQFVGRVSDGERNRLLATSQVFVAPNTGGESFGIVVAEAMAAGCAVVASDLRAFRDVLGDCGRTFPVGDVNSLTVQIVDLLSDPSRARTLGEDAKAAVKRFDWSVVTAAYRTSYRRAIAG